MIFNRTALLTALLLGALSALAFEPVGWWPLMPIAFAFLYAFIDRAPTLKRALLTGWLFGLGQFAVGHVGAAEVERRLLAVERAVADEDEPERVGG